MIPLSSAIDLTTVPVAGDQLTGDEVCSRALGHLPWIVVELAAPLLGIEWRPELNGVSRVSREASYDEDSWR